MDNSMDDLSYSGRLERWNDDQGFGFIRTRDRDGIPCESQWCGH